MKWPCLKAKGQESRHLVQYAVDITGRLPDNRKCALLHTAGKFLIQWYDTIADTCRVMDRIMQERLFTLALNHVAIYKSAGGHLVHKHHAFVHLSQKVASAGNCGFFSTAEDESENGVIARVGVMVHSRTFDISVFERLELADRDRDEE